MSTGSSDGALRAAVAALQGNGGFAVQLRMPGQAASGSIDEQLGLATPQFQDVCLWPAAWRKVGRTKELLVSAAAVNQLTGATDVASAQELMASAVGVEVDGVLYGITGSAPLMAAGTACAYRITLSAPVWQ